MASIAHGSEPPTKAGDGGISIVSEQRYWDAWIEANHQESGSLQPFLNHSSRANIPLLSRKIRSLGVHEYSVFFARVNIYRRTVRIVYLTWDSADTHFHLIHGDAISGRFSKGKLGIENEDFFGFIKEISDSQTFVDLSKSKVFDADSVYVTIKKNDDLTRFAAYAPELVMKDGQLAMGRLLVYLDELSR